MSTRRQVVVLPEWLENKGQRQEERQNVNKTSRSSLARRVVGIKDKTRGKTERQQDNK
jgi:hypothetical protein